MRVFVVVEVSVADLVLALISFLLSHSIFICIVDLFFSVCVNLCDRQLLLLLLLVLLLLLLPLSLMKICILFSQSLGKYYIVTLIVIEIIYLIRIATDVCLSCLFARPFREAGKISSRQNAHTRTHILNKT